MHSVTYLQISLRKIKTHPDSTFTLSRCRFFLGAQNTFKIKQGHLDVIQIHRVSQNIPAKFICISRTIRENSIALPVPPKI